MDVSDLADKYLGHLSQADRDNFLFRFGRAFSAELDAEYFSAIRGLYGEGAIRFCEAAFIRHPSTAAALNARFQATPGDAT